MINRLKGQRIWILVGLAAALLAAAVCGLILVGRGVRSTAGMRARWDARTFEDYRMRVEVANLAQYEMEVEVRGDDVALVDGQPPTPGRPMPYTVERLFDEIDAFEPGQCGPNGCACDGPILMEAEYDAVLGYPTRIEVDVHPEARWQYPGTWLHTIRRGGCTLVGYIGKTIRVLALVPLG